MLGRMSPFRHARNLLRALPIALALGAAAGCTPDGVPGHELGLSSKSHPGVLGQTASGSVPADGGGGAVEDAGGGAGGDTGTEPAPLVVDLPYSNGISLKVADDEAATAGAYGGSYVAFESLGEAQDVRAMAEGDVVYLELDHIQGGLLPELTAETNRMIVLHDDGTKAEYLHLRQNGSFFSLGDRVQLGDVIALSGSTGYAGGPRIGVRLIRKGATVPFCFRTATSECDVPEPGEVLQSSNPSP